MIDHTRNLELEEFIMSRLVSMKINLFESWIAHLLKKQQTILEALIRTKAPSMCHDFGFSIPHYEDIMELQS